jgi:hypothetical protein
MASKLTLARYQQRVGCMQAQTSMDRCTLSGGSARAGLVWCVVHTHPMCRVRIADPRCRSHSTAKTPLCSGLRQVTGCNAQHRGAAVPHKLTPCCMSSNALRNALHTSGRQMPVLDMQIIGCVDCSKKMSEHGHRVSPRQVEALVGDADGPDSLPCIVMHRAATWCWQAHSSTGCPGAPLQADPES